MTVPNVPDLSAFDDSYQQAEAYENEFPDVPDGTYHAIVEKLELTTSQSGNPMLKWQMTVVEDTQYTGRKLFHNNMITSPENIRWLKTDLERAGLNIVRVSELQDPAVRERLIGVKLKVQKKTKSSNGEQFENVYIQKRLDDQTPPMAPQPAIPPNAYTAPTAQPQQGYPPQGQTPVNQQPQSGYAQPQQQPVQTPQQPAPQNCPQTASNLPRF